MSASDNVVNYSTQPGLSNVVRRDAELRKGPFVPTIVNHTQLTNAQADIARLCSQVATDPEFAFEVWMTLRGLV